jgi:DNA-binding FadR family transcriptional regulator
MSSRNIEQLFRPAQTRRTFEDAIEQIADAIQAGDLQQGDRLPTERNLAAQMQISRPTLREAIHVLAEAGIIDVKPGKGGGMFIRSEQIPADVIHRGVEYRISEISSVLESRRMIEPRVAQLAALRAHEDHFAAMERTIEQQRDPSITPERFVQLDIRFHITIARATQNESLVKVMRLLLGGLWIVRQSAMHTTGDFQTAIDIHERTLRAIMSRSPQEVEPAMNEHLDFLETHWREETGRASVRQIPDFLLPPEGRQ